MGFDISESKDAELKKDAAKISIQEGSATMLMEGFGNRYITPYAIALGASNSQIGFISSFPGLLGNLLQIPFLYLMKRNSRKKIVFFSVLLQAILWLPIISIGFFYFYLNISSQLASNLLILSYGLMIIAGTISSPAWNSWMKDIIDENKGKYFGKRNRILNLVLVISMLSAGIILNYFGKEGAFKGFLIIFVIAFIGRAVSAYLLKKQYEPSFKYEEKDYFSFLDFIRKMFFNNFGRFVILVSLVSFATAVAGPFFAVYLLEDLNLSYILYSTVVLGNVIATILFMPFWGRFSDKYGNAKVLKITGLLIPLIPIIYLFSYPLNNFASIYIVVFYLLIVEMFSGFSWAGFNLSQVNFVYDAVTKQKMALCFAYFNIINAFGTFIGASIGGFVLTNWNFIFGIKSIFVIFVASAFLRLFFVLIIMPKIKEVRSVKRFEIKNHFKIITKVEHWVHLWI